MYIMKYSMLVLGNSRIFLDKIRMGLGELEFPILQYISSTCFQFYSVIFFLMSRQTSLTAKTDDYLCLSLKILDNCYTTVNKNT